MLLEYDDERSGSFDALKDIPDDKFVILGLITTKKPELETMDSLMERITAAKRYVPLNRLGLSPQCGFASSVVGNNLSAQDQRRKLELLMKVAQALWPEQSPKK